VNSFGFDGSPTNSADPWGLACLRNPKTIKFSQNGVSREFSDGSKVSDLIGRFKSDPSYAERIEPIRLVRFRDLPGEVQEKLAAQGASEHSVWSLDNRRLYAARVAKVPFINTRWATPDEIAQFATPRRFSTTNGGGLPELQ
jgi:hypothetical protein